MLAARISDHYDSLADFLQKTDSIENWNDYVQDTLRGSRRKSFAAIGVEMHRCVTTNIPTLQVRLAEMGNPTVAAVKTTPDLCHRVAQLLNRSAGELRMALANYPGGKRVSGILDELLSPTASGPRSSQDQSSTVSVAATLPATPTAGTILSPGYQLLHSLGEGGFGVAYLARNRRTRRQCVVKLAHPHQGSDSLHREFEFGRRFDHRHLCRYLEKHEDPSYGVYLVLEYGGESILQRYKDSPAPLQDVVKVLQQAASALDYLHENRVVHADISPGNILIDDEGVVRISDFGVSANLRASQSTSRPAAHSEEVTRVATSLIGINNRFSAPEVVRREKAQAASDQASLAFSICAMLQGVAAYMRKSKFQFSVLSAEQAEALTRATSLDPKKRFPNCGAFAWEFCSSDANTTHYKASTTRRRRASATP